MFSDFFTSFFNNTTHAKTSDPLKKLGVSTPYLTDLSIKLLEKEG